MAYLAQCHSAISIMLVPKFQLALQLVTKIEKT